VPGVTSRCARSFAGRSRGTRSYIQHFAQAASTASSANDVVTAMVEKFPDYGNLTTLIFSAAAAVRRRPT
jgi:hypothetical protein